MRERACLQREFVRAASISVCVYEEACICLYIHTRIIYVAVAFLGNESEKYGN